MKKNNYTYLLFSIFVINFISISYTGKSFADNDISKYIFGKVVYEDNGSPVTNGLIKVLRVNEITNQFSILETATIESNGEFKVLIQPIQIEFGIKIMAYPNDYDNMEVPFETKMLDLKKIVTINNDGVHSVTIRVNRINDNTVNSQDIKKSGTGNNFFLKQNFPNPFNPTTLIRFELPQTSNVTLKIYNMNGEAIATLADNKNLLKGLNEFEFDASGLSSGIYVYSLTAGNYTETKKMMLLK